MGALGVTLCHNTADRQMQKAIADASGDEVVSCGFGIFRGRHSSSFALVTAREMDAGMHSLPEAWR
jgi:hypothetical protein